MSVYKLSHLLTFSSLWAGGWGSPLGLLALLVGSVLLLLLTGADRVVRSSLTSPPARFAGACTAAGHLQPLAANGSAVSYLAPAAGAASTGVWIWAVPFPARSSYLGGVSSESTPRKESEGDCEQKTTAMCVLQTDSGWVAVHITKVWNILHNFFTDLSPMLSVWNQSWYIPQKIM